MRGSVAMCVLAAGLAFGCQRQAPATKSSGEQAKPSGQEDSIQAKGLRNVHRVSYMLLSGSSPEGEAGFRSLQELGVKTIISVDGARPNVEAARQFGLRYVHLPIGYDGVPKEQGLRIAKAVRDLPGLVYLHCHHGKHRSPAAAVVARLCLDETCNVEEALALMRKAGTDPKYVGLYAAPKELVRPSAKELDSVSSEFPEVAQIGGLTQAMAEIDERWEHLKLVRMAGWQSPKDHPDIDPPHEALLLLERFREAARLPSLQKRTEEFRRWLAEAEVEATELEAILRDATAQGQLQADRADALLSRMGAGCAQCHARYRDVPHGR